MLITKDLLQPGDISPPLNGELGLVMRWIVEVQGGTAGVGVPLDVLVGAFFGDTGS